MKPKNVAAKSLKLPRFKPKIVENRKKYNRARFKRAFSLDKLTEVL